MDTPNKLGKIDGIGLFRAEGSQRFQQAVALVTEAIVEAGEQGVSKLMVAFRPPA